MKKGAEKCLSHAPRHSDGDDIKTVQANVGHATAAFTLDVYGHVSQKMQQDSADRMQGYFEGLKEQKNAQ